MLKLLEYLYIQENTGSLTPEALIKNPRFQTFLFKLKGKEKLEDRVSIGIFQENAGSDVCRLEYKGRRISFLLSGNLDDDLRFFKDEYASKISAPVKRERYEIKEICLKNYETNSFEIEVGIEQESSSSSAELSNEAKNLAARGDYLLAWTLLNSLGRQIKPENPDAARYLEIMQEQISSKGAIHLTYDGFPSTEAKYELKGDIFKTKDPLLEGKIIKAFTFTSDLGKAVFFEPGIHQAMLHASSAEGKIILKINANSLADIKIE
jgi:hypothetical protein